MSDLLTDGISTGTELTGGQSGFAAQPMQPGTASDILTGGISTGAELTGGLSPFASSSDNSVSALILCGVAGRGEGEYDGYIGVRIGEIAPVVVEIDCQGGTEQIGSPAPTVQVLNVDGTPAEGWTAALACTGYDTASGGSARAWHNLDVSELRTRWYYVAVFTILLTGSDNITRRFQARLLLIT